MKKNICKLIMPAMIAAVMISGCARQGTMPTPETPEQATPEDIEAPEPTPTLSPVFELSDKPFDAYDFPALVGMQLSVRQANEMFGQPKGAFAYVQAADGQTYLCIEYNAAYLELTGLPLTLAQRGGGVLESMTEEDLVLDLNVDSVWIRRESEALHRTVRDVGIGSSRGQVLNAFLNLSDKYTDSVLYTIADINPEWGEDWTDSFVGGRIKSGEGAAVPVVRNTGGQMEYTAEPIECDEVIQYTYVNDFEDYPLDGPGQWNTYASLRFYVKNGIVTDVFLFRFTDPE